MLAFLIWGSIGIVGSKNTAFILDFIESDYNNISSWVVDSNDPTMCCNVDSDGCVKYDPHLDPNGAHVSLQQTGDLGEDSMDCINSLSASDIKGDILVSCMISLLFLFRYQKACFRLQVCNSAPAFYLRC